MLSSSIRKQSYTNGTYTENQVKAVIKSCNIKIGSEIDTHFLIFCPFHYNVNSPACEIDKSSGLFICFSCGETGSLLDLVMRTTGRNYFESTRFINSKETEIDIADAVKSALEFDPDYLKEFDISLIDKLHNGLMKNDKAKNYFLSRNIYENSWVEMKLGYSEKQDMVIVPVHDNFGMCVGFVARGIDKKVFKNSVGLPKKNVLFNLHRSKYKSITVVESSFDAIRMWQLGIPAVATLGAWPSKVQLELLSKYSENIILCPDKDDAGKKMVSKVLEGVKNKSVLLMDVGNVKDVGDLDDNEIISKHVNASNLKLLGI